MKIYISYPPFSYKNKKPFLSQNRQFQWTNTGNVIFPVVSAYGATTLKQLGHDVFWDDSIAEKLNYSTWLNKLLFDQPDIIFFETKTPVVKKHWSLIGTIRKHQTKNWHPLIVLMGDHVTALPRESLLKSTVDYIITGGDYDFMMVNLINHLSKKVPLESGFWFKKNHRIYNTGKFSLIHHNLDSLPLIDRELTKWKLYSSENTNYQNKPGAYIMSGRDCWWGKCTFCSWTTLYPHGTFRTFSVDHTIREIEYLISLGIKDIFDDSGTFPTGKWLFDFCTEIIKRGINHKVTFGCNMRFGALNQESYYLLKKAGFCFILYGLESNNQNTLDRISKNCSVSDARISLKYAVNAKIKPHLTIMVGYPWETLKDVRHTLTEAKNILSEGLANSLQATIVIPYPGTPLFKYCLKNKLLTTMDWNKYDMQLPVIKSKISAEKQISLVNTFYKSVLTPGFLIHKIASVRSFSDLKLIFLYSIKFFKKLRDFQT